MKKLLINLPPLCADYSGVGASLYELGGMTIVHDAAGCTANYVRYDESRWLDESSMVYCSALRELESIMGDDNIIIDKIKKALKDLNPNFIAVLGTPVTMLIGTDLKGLAFEIENATKIPCIGFDTTGLSLYTKGIEMAGIELINRMAKVEVEKVKNSINIIGFTSIDFSDNTNVQEIKNFLEDNSMIINSSLFMNTSISDVEEILKGEINIAVSLGGYKIAEYLYKKYDIPFFPGVPVGTGKQFLMRFREFISGGKIINYKSSNDNEKLLIIGDQIFANSLRDEIYSIKNDFAIHVGSMFGLEKSIASEGDFSIESESDLRKILKNYKFKKVIGDSFFKPILPRNSNTEFIEIPHIGISGKLSFGKCKNHLGKDMIKIISKICE